MEQDLPANLLAAFIAAAVLEMFTSALVVPMFISLLEEVKEEERATEISSTIRANPKSQIFNEQSSFSKMLAGFKSRWMTLPL
mmetsp:Transcript_3941/g.8472  ORF Transcript_3941/g.8472 Transcript_3941/m.8472 type:complete len:83 (-) Transcript_3941:523-771(-)